MKINKITAFIFATLILAGCGGGSGGGGSSSDGAVSGKIVNVEASVTSDTCGERISSVNQQFVIGDGVIDSRIASIPATFSGGDATASFSESNGDCTRDYTVEISGYNSSSPHFTLTANSTCGSSSCKSVWQGTGSAGSSLRELEDNSIFRINGERCNPNVPSTVGYRPSAFECNGNAAVLLSGRERSNYSVVVRRDGQYNDRDPNNPSCGTNRCSPYKTQKKLELPEYQVNCLGASGFSDYFASVNRISIKYTALVSNPSDTSQFEQYCLNNVKGEMN